MRAVHYNAAGGVVIALQQEGGDYVLVLRRPGRDETRLPKGHVQVGESLPEAALREVIEESGYIDLEMVTDLGHQIVEFDHQGNHVIRDEYYFLLRLKSNRQIERDLHEHQFIPLWLTWDEAQAQLTYPAEREWLRRAREQA